MYLSPALRVILLAFSLTHCWTVVIDSITGPADHALVFKSKLRESLSQVRCCQVLDREMARVSFLESELASADNGREGGPSLEAAQLGVRAVITRLPSDAYDLQFSVVDLQSLKVLFSKSVQYDHSEKLEGAASYLAESMDAHFDTDMKMVREKYLKTEQEWRKLGFSAYDWEAYYKSGIPLRDWTAQFDFKPKHAALFALCPVYSGLNYTKNWGPGIFWSILEGAVILYGATAKENTNRMWAFASLIPITGLDIYFSLNSVKKSKVRIQGLQRHYQDSPLPFKFME